MEIRGTATDFCSAVSEYVEGFRKGGTFEDARKVLVNSGADMIRFAPTSLRNHVTPFVHGLWGVAENIGLGVINSNALLAQSLNPVNASPDGKAVSDYAKANCK